jgi:hypothetical protein
MNVLLRYKEQIARVSAECKQWRKYGESIKR